MAAVGIAGVAGVVVDTAAADAVAAVAGGTGTPAVSRRSDDGGSDFAAAAPATTDDGRQRWPDRTNVWTVCRTRPSSAAGFSVHVCAQLRQPTAAAAASIGVAMVGTVAVAPNAAAATFRERMAFLWAFVCGSCWDAFTDASR